jgi:hypothetical protein
VKSIVGPASVCVALALIIAAVAAPVRAQFPAPQPQQPQPQPPGPQPQQPQPPGPPPAATTADPRLAQVKAALERQGMRVLEVITIPQRGASVGGWGVVTQAAYAQPSYQAISKQALDVWWVMYGVFSQEPAGKRLVAAQAWSR